MPQGSSDGDSPGEPVNIDIRVVKSAVSVSSSPDLPAHLATVGLHMHGYQHRPR